MEIAVAVTAIGTIIFLAHLFAAFFEQSRVPDVLPLVLIGLIIGPITGLATIQHFGEVGPVFANLTLVIILFESGLNMKLTSLRKALGPAAILGFVGFILSVAVVVVTLKVLCKLPDTSALILGTTLGGTAASIALPLLKGLNLQERTKTALVLESILGNVLSIVVTIALMTAVELDRFAPTMVLRDIAASFTMACIVGAIFGYMWSSLLVRIRTLAHTKFTTPACVCISYGFAEMFGFSGMLASLAFGIVMGNAERLPHSKLSSSTWLRPISLNDDERALFAELVFLLKTFFFVYLGISIQAIGEMDLVYAGSIIVIWLFISRPLLVRLALPRIKTTKLDATIACIMIPRGLAAAVLASIAVSKGIEDALICQSIAYSVVITSIAMTALFSFFCERKLLTQPYRFIFTGYKEDPVAGETKEEEEENDTKLEEDEENEEELETESILHYVEDYHHHPDPKKKSSNKKAKQVKPYNAASKEAKVSETPKTPKEQLPSNSLITDSLSNSDNTLKDGKKSGTAKETKKLDATKSSVSETERQKRPKSSSSPKAKSTKNAKGTTPKEEPQDAGVNATAPEKNEQAEKSATKKKGQVDSIDVQRTTTSTVSLSHSVGPTADGTTEIVAHHHEGEEDDVDVTDLDETKEPSNKDNELDSKR